MATKLSSGNGLIQQEIWAGGGVYWAQTFLTRSNTWLTSSKFRKLGLFWPKAPDLFLGPSCSVGKTQPKRCGFLSIPGIYKCLFSFYRTQPPENSCFLFMVSARVFCCGGQCWPLGKFAFNAWDGWERGGAAGSAKISICLLLIMAF